MIRTFPRLSERPNENGCFEIRWTERDQAGRPRTKRRSTRTGDRAEAEKALARFLTIREEPRKEPKIREIFSAYIEQHSEPRGNEATDKANMAAPLQCFGDWPPSAIRQSDVDAYVLRRQNGAYSPKKVKAKPSTARREIAALQAVLNFGSRKELIPGAPTFKFAKPEDGEARVLWMTEQQEQEVMAKLPEAPLTVQIFIRLALTYGVRRGAIMELMFGEQTNFVTGQIDFNVPGKRRTRKRRPIVPMTKALRALLAQMLERKKRGARVCDIDTPKLYEDFMTSLGFGWVTPHVLKHTAITLMLRAGVAELDVSRLTSTDLRTIARVYRHHSQDELAAIAERRSI